MKSIFSEFTHLYPVSKTLRFELVPIGKTEGNMKKEDLLKSDFERRENYEKIKPLFDELHNQFITESLQNLSLNWEAFLKKYLENQKSTEENKRKNREELENISDSLRKDFFSGYQHTADIWKKKYLDESKKEKPILKEEGYKILTEEGILEVLKNKYAEEPEIVKVVSSFKRFFTYFTGFNQNRENYYSTEKKATSVAYRAVNDNLMKFSFNISIYQKIVNNPELENVFTDNSEYFNINLYSKFLIQKGIDEYNQKIGLLNKEINLYNQQNKQNTKIPLFKTLFKQIGSSVEKEKLFYVIDNKEYTLEQALNDLQPEAEDLFSFAKVVIKYFQEQKNLNGIYLNKIAINTISNKYFTNWYTLAEQLFSAKLVEKSKEGEFKVKKPINLKIFETVLDNGDSSLFKESFVNNANKSLKPFEIFKEIYTQELEKTLSTSEESQKALDLKEKSSVKKYCDSLIDLLRMIKYFRVSEEEVDEDFDTSFYNQLFDLLENTKVEKLYNAIRNYLTQKPYSTDKIKLNFNCSILCGGWDTNKESEKRGIIIKDKDFKYLAIIDSRDTKIFEKDKNSELYKTQDTEVQKMEYKLLPGPNKMLPKVFFAKSNQNIFKPSERIINIKEKGLYKKSANDKDALREWIDFCKKSIPLYPDWSMYKFNFKDTKQYEDVSEFYKDVSKNGYKLDFVPINKDILDKMVEEGKVYLFRIQSKDNHKKENTKSNLHTMYWDAVFNNFDIVKLNGDAEIFFRKASLKEKEKKVTNKNITIDYAIKNKRYTEDKYLFHVPITLNWSESTRVKEYTQKLNSVIRQNVKDIHVIGIDRGEKHLAYYSVIDSKGTIIEQGTLNKDLLGKDYLALLSSREKSRMAERKDWDTIERIKDLKEGYISQVIKRLADLVIKYNGVIVLEDLNSGFKRGRQKIEKSVYQKLELAIAQKLNYLAIKDKGETDTGSIINAYQLIPQQITTYKDLENRKQVGVMFYTRAAYTSVTDPASGFRKNIYIARDSKEKMRKNILKLSEIKYDQKERVFMFKYNTKNFDTKNGLDKEWALYSNVERIKRNRNDKGNWESHTIDVTKELLTLFEKYDIDIKQNILAQIANNSSLENHFYETLIYLINLILQLRNSDEENDFILSPIKDKTGYNFDSRKYLTDYPINERGESEAQMPINGDSNGAYNIARKGLVMIQRIKNNNESNLYISDHDWDIISQDWIKFTKELNG